MSRPLSRARALALSRRLIYSCALEGTIDTPTCWNGVLQSPSVIVSSHLWLFLSFSLISLVPLSLSLARALAHASLRTPLTRQLGPMVSCPHYVSLCLSRSSSLSASGLSATREKCCCRAAAAAAAAREKSAAAALPRCCCRAAALLLLPPLLWLPLPLLRHATTNAAASCVTTAVWGSRAASGGCLGQRLHSLVRQVPDVTPAPGSPGGRPDHPPKRAGLCGDRGPVGGPHGCGGCLSGRCLCCRQPSAASVATAASAAAAAAAAGAASAAATRAGPPGAISQPSGSGQRGRGGGILGECEGFIARWPDSCHA